MELEHLLIKQNSKKIVTQESSITDGDLKEVHHTNFARTHVPNVFEHQYAEYISGLKPPYSDLGDLYAKGKSHQKDARDQKFNGE